MQDLKGIEINQLIFIREDIKENYIPTTIKNINLNSNFFQKNSISNAPCTEQNFFKKNKCIKETFRLTGNDFFYSYDYCDYPIQDNQLFNKIFFEPIKLIESIITPYYKTASNQILNINIFFFSYREFLKSNIINYSQIQICHPSGELPSERPCDCGIDNEAAFPFIWKPIDNIDGYDVIFYDKNFKEFTRYPITKGDTNNLANRLDIAYNEALDKFGERVIYYFVVRGWVVCNQDTIYTPTSNKQRFLLEHCKVVPCPVCKNN
jgi:hypothetical protein